MTADISSPSQHGYAIDARTANSRFAPLGQSSASITNDNRHTTAFEDHSTPDSHFGRQQDDPNPSPVRCWPEAISPEWVWSQ